MHQQHSDFSGQTSGREIQTDRLVQSEDENSDVWVSDSPTVQTFSAFILVWVKISKYRIWPDISWFSTLYVITEMDHCQECSIKLINKMFTSSTFSSYLWFPLLKEWPTERMDQLQSLGTTVSLLLCFVLQQQLDQDAAVDFKREMTTTTRWFSIFPTPLIINLLKIVPLGKTRCYSENGLWGQDHS